jgi:hypothetical protein
LDRRRQDRAEFHEPLLPFNIGVTEEPQESTAPEVVEPLPEDYDPCSSTAGRLLRRIAPGFYQGLWKVIGPPVHGTREMVAHYRRKLLYRHLKSPILIYQMGKVGSLTLLASLRKLQLPVPVMHCHVLNNLEAIEEHFRGARENHAGPVKAIANGRKVLEELAGNPKKKWDVITLVRDPIARNISHFFHIITEIIPDIEERRQNGTIRLEELVRVFLETEEASMVPRIWFDEQMKPVFGVDVFETPFPHDQGYQIIKKGRFRLLIIRLEDLNACVGLAIRHYLRVKEMAIINVNVAENKGYADLYREFLRTVRLPDEYVNAVYGTQYARHFYTPVELQAFRERWQKGRPEGRG